MEMYVQIIPVFGFVVLFVGSDDFLFFTVRGDEQVAFSEYFLQRFLIVHKHIAGR